MTYLISLAVGLLVGVIYGALDVRSPAPPVIALVGLLGILVGEQVPHLVRRALAGETVNVGTAVDQCRRHVFGRLPDHRPPAAPTHEEPRGPRAG